MIDFRELKFQQADLEELIKLEIDFAFQPIFNAKNLEISAYEALMRPKGKPPLTLIAEYQQKKKLHVIELATCFGATMEYKKRGYDKYLCLNSFPSEVMSHAQIELYFECFPEMDGKIIVEMLEYTELNKYKWTEKKDEISHNEMKVALDDYSTGNNDISAVDFFLPQYVKLDRSLISNVHNDKAKQAKINELVAHFHEREIEVVAEGVETEAEFTYLRMNTGVDYLQGYYLAMPK